MEQRKLPVLCAQRVLAALASGWLALLFADFPLVLDRVYDVRFSWQLFFPLLIAVAWEPVYAWITALGGMVFLLPFLESPARGWGNLFIGALYLLLLLACGHFCGRAKKAPNYYLVFVSYSALYCAAVFILLPLLLPCNPVSGGYQRFLSPIINRVQAISFVFSILSIAAFLKVLLSLPGFCKLLRIEPLPYSEHNTLLFGTMLLVVFGFFVIDGVFESFYFESRGLHTSLLSANFGRLVKLPIVFAAGCILCDAIICSTMKNLESHHKLLKSEERYRMIFQHTADAYFEIDSSGIVHKANPAVLQNLSRSPDQVCGKHISRLFAQEQEIEQLLTRLFGGEQINNVELRGRSRQPQNPVNLLVSGNVMQLDEQRLAVLTVRNISDYKKAEEKRWELSALLNAIFESNQDFIWTVDCVSFSLLSFNHAFYSYIAKTSGSAIGYGSSPREIFPEDSERFLGYYRAVLKQGDFSTEYTAPDGQLILNLNFYPVKLHEEIASIAVFTKNITAQKRAERKIVELNAGLEQTVAERTRELRNAYSDLESFSYTVTHEFRTPIREINAYLEIIEEDNQAGLAPQSRSDIRSAKRVCAQTLDMIQNMMYYTKAGFMVLNIEWVNMRQLVRECFQNLQQANEQREMHLRLYDLPPLYADLFLMRTAILNVFANCVKFAKPNDPLVIVAGCMRSKDQITYYFHDNGVGFESELGSNLFDLFHRAHNNSEYEGNGIGLALVRRVLARNRGQVGILGAPGKGCTVYFIFSQESGQP